MKAYAIITRNNNFLVKIEENFFFMNRKYQILRHSTEEEWSNLVAYTGYKVTEIEIPADLLNEIEGKVIYLGEYKENISDTCTQMGQLYRIFEKDGEKVIAWVTGCMWHGYEGAIGYEPYQLNKLVWIEGKPESTAPSTGKRRRQPVAISESGRRR